MSNVITRQHADKIARKLKSTEETGSKKSGGAREHISFVVYHNGVEIAWFGVRRRPAARPYSQGLESQSEQMQKTCGLHHRPRRVHRNHEAKGPAPGSGGALAGARGGRRLAEALASRRAPPEGMSGFLDTNQEKPDDRGRGSGFRGLGACDEAPLGQLPAGKRPDGVVRAHVPERLRLEGPVRVRKSRIPASEVAAWPPGKCHAPCARSGESWAGLGRQWPLVYRW